VFFTNIIILSKSIVNRFIAILDFRFYSSLTWLGGRFSGSGGAVASLEAELAKKTWIFNKITVPASELRHKHALTLDCPPKLQTTREQQQISRSLLIIVR
jgi:hypothetical protein